MLSKLFGGKRKLEPQAQDEDLLQRICAAVLDATHSHGGKVLLYTEVEDGMISADLFSQVAADTVRFRFAPHDLKNLIYEFWETAPVSDRWSTMTFTIDDGRFNCQLGYADSLEPEEDLADRRPRVVEMHFGGAAVDYSSPQ